MTPRIITNNVYPPIPDRQFDWCAYHDGTEEQPWRYGWGPTEAEAIRDLKRLDKEYADAEDATSRIQSTMPIGLAPTPTSPRD